MGNINAIEWMDVIVVQQPDGSLKSSPFILYFTEQKEVLPSGTSVNVISNGKEISWKMSLADNKSAFFPDTTVDPQIPKRVLPTSDELRLLELKPGENKLEFVASSYKITKRAFLWKHDTKIVVTDIDGTITTSVFYAFASYCMGKECTWPSVPKFFEKIHLNGYEILYLTYRPSPLAESTKTFLTTLAEGTTKMPTGPVILRGNLNDPKEMKATALKAVKELFETNPFYAGIGDEITDYEAYIAAGIDDSKIFKLNKDQAGKLCKGIETDGFNYEGLMKDVNELFPKLE